MSDKRKRKLPSFDSLLAILPFTKTGKETEDILKKVNSTTFFEAEKKRIDEIQNLVDEGKYKQALRELISDTDEEFGLDYYNRVRYEEEIAESKADTSSKLSDERHLPEKVKRLENEEGNQKDHCSWQGFNGRGAPLICTNQTMHHPWKTYVNVYGRTEAFKTDFCVFHQKYCVDIEKKHGNNLVHIPIPNKDALCNECYVRKNGEPPTQVPFRLPGVRRSDPTKHSDQTREKDSSRKG